MPPRIKNPADVASRLEQQSAFRRVTFSLPRDVIEFTMRRLPTAD